VGKDDKDLNAKTQPGTATNDWKVTLNDASIQRVNFRFDNNNDPKISRGMDYSHLNLKDFNLKASDISYTSEAIAGNIISARVKDQSGLDLQELRTGFYYGPRSAYLKNL